LIGISLLADAVQAVSLQGTVVDIARDNRTGESEAVITATSGLVVHIGEHPCAIYRGWRLVAIDGSQTSVSNIPQLLRHLSKAASRRFQAAFAKVPLCWLVELGTHAPLVAVIGLAQESEWALAHRLLT
jgi:hypothetical protein